MSRAEMQRRLSAAQFAAWETHLFLDTHPDDATAQAEFSRYREQATALLREFEEKFGPLTPADIYGDKRFEWLSSPWPWEVDREGDR